MLSVISLCFMQSALQRLQVEVHYGEYYEHRRPSFWFRRYWILVSLDNFYSGFPIKAFVYYGWHSWCLFYNWWLLSWWMRTVFSLIRFLVSFLLLSLDFSLGFYFWSHKTRKRASILASHTKGKGDQPFTKAFFTSLVIRLTNQYYRKRKMKQYYGDR